MSNKIFGENFSDGNSNVLIHYHNQNPPLGFDIEHTPPLSAQLTYIQTCRLA